MINKLARATTMELSVRVFYSQITASLPGLGSSLSVVLTGIIAVIMLHIATSYRNRK